MNNDELRVGLWQKTSPKTGKEYYGGKFELDGKTYYVTMFDKNVNKTNPNQPDYNIILKLAEAKKETKVEEDDSLPF